MKKFILPFIFISSTLLFTACPFVTTVREFEFDETAFNEAKQKWEDKKLSNYSFKYIFDGATPCLVIGNVKVSNSEGIIETLTLYWDLYIREGSKYYHRSYDDKGKLERKEDTDGGANFEENLASIEKRYSVQLKTVEEIFELIESRILKNTIEFNNSDTITTYSLQVEYNPQYGYPEKVREDISKKDDPKFTSDLVGFSTTTLNLKVSDFK